jgi:hypothetical protein
VLVKIASPPASARASIAATNGNYVLESLLSKIVLDMCAGLKYLRNIRGNQPPGDGQMFYFTPYSTGVLNTNTEALASKLGLILGAAGAVKKSNWDSKPAVAGKTFPIKDALKANGARWDGLAKAWTFDTEVALEAALKAIMEVA